MPSRQIPNLPGQDIRAEFLPELRQFVENVDRTLGSGPVQHFWQCRGFFEGLASGNFPRDLINYELTKVTERQFYGPPSSSSSQFTVYISDFFSLSIARVVPSAKPPPQLQGLTHHAMIRVLGPAPITVDMYRSEADSFEVLDRSKLLEYVGRSTVEISETLTLRAGIDVPRITAAGETLFISFISAPVHEIMWEYDASSLAPIRAVSDNLATSRIEYALDILSRVGANRHLPVLLELFEHHAHFIRWAAVKSVVKIDRGEGIRLLQRAVEDPHPHVRLAAQTTLQSINQ